MKWNLATDVQLQTIIKHEYDCFPSLLRGAVMEMLNRGLFDRIIAKAMHSSVNVQRLDQVFGVGADDLLQIGRIEVLKALKTFDASRGQSFQSFLYQSVKSELLNEVTTLTAQKRDCSSTISIHTKTLSEKSLEFFIPDQKQNVEKYVLNKITVEHLLENLNDYQVKIIMYRMKGYTYQEIGREIGKNFRTIHNDVKNALNLMRKGA